MSFAFNVTHRSGGARRPPSVEAMSNAPAGRGPSVLSVPEGDNRERMVCPDCGFINYENPKIVVGSVCVWQEQFLLCRRAINPRRGYWTLPAGYLELQESTPAGAIREAGHKNIFYFPSMHQGIEYLLREARTGDAIFTIGAGNISRASNELMVLLGTERPTTHAHR